VKIDFAKNSAYNKIALYRLYFDPEKVKVAKCCDISINWAFSVLFTKSINNLVNG